MEEKNKKDYDSSAILSDAKLLTAYIEKMQIENGKSTQKNIVGRNMFMTCVSPDHTDNHPSLVVSVKNNKAYCHCFACRFNANLAKLIYIDKFAKDRIETPDEQSANIKKNYRSIMDIAQKFQEGIDVSEIEVSEYKKGIIKNYLSFYRTFLNKNELAIDYLKSRGISEDITRKLGIFNDEDNNIIFPHSQTDYCIRAANPKDKASRYKHIGSKTLFFANGHIPIKKDGQKEITQLLGTLKYDENSLGFDTTMKVSKLPIHFFCEGEINSLSVMQSLSNFKEETSHFFSAAMSGVQGTKLLYDYLDIYFSSLLPLFGIKFDNLNREIFSEEVELRDGRKEKVHDFLQTKIPIVLCMDNDKAGYSCAYEISKTMQEKYGLSPYIFPLPSKYNDINEFLIDDPKGLEKEMTEFVNMIYQKDATNVLRQQKELEEKYRASGGYTPIDRFKINNEILNTYQYNGIEIYDYIDKNTDNRVLGNLDFSFDIKYFNKQDKVSIIKENGEDIVLVKNFSKKYNREFSTKYKYDFDENTTINLTQQSLESKKKNSDDELKHFVDGENNELIYFEKRENSKSSVGYIYPHPDCIVDFISKNSTENSKIILYPNDSKKKPMLTMNGHYIDTFEASVWQENSLVKKYNDFSKNILFEEHVYNGIAIKQIENGIGICPDENNPKDKKNIINDFLRSRNISKPETYLSYFKSQKPLSAEVLSNSIMQAKELDNPADTLEYLEFLKTKSFISSGKKYTILDLKVRNGQISSIFRDSSNGYKYVINDFGKISEQNTYYTFGKNTEIDTSNKKSVYVENFEKLESKQKQK